ncbi:MAG: YkgJ family cysteine cluster protein [Planctomycetota bacterium]
MGDPWYQDGLNFSCTECGKCCTGDPGYVWVSKGEIERLAKTAGLSVSKFSSRYVRAVGRRYSLTEHENGDCVFWDPDGRGCKVYEARPTQCRTFPFWPEVLKNRKSWDETADECPGVNTGRLYPVEEITLLRRGEGETGAKPAR